MYLLRNDGAGVLCLFLAFIGVFAAGRPLSSPIWSARGLEMTTAPVSASRQFSVNGQGESANGSTDGVRATRGVNSYVIDAHNRFNSIAPSRAGLVSDYSKVGMQVLVSLIVLIGSMILLFRGQEATQKIACGLIGTVVGYWLR